MATASHRPASTRTTTAARTPTPSQNVPLLSSAAAPASLTDAPVSRRSLTPLAPLSFALPSAALGELPPPACDDAGAVAGVGSNGTQPIPRNQTSTQECASRSRTRYSLVVES